MSQVEQMERGSRCDNRNRCEESEELVMASNSLAHFGPVGGGRTFVPRLDVFLWCSDGLVRIPYLPCPAEESLREGLRTLHSALQCWGVFCEPGTLQGPRVCWGGKQCPYAGRSGWSGVEVCVKCTGTGVRETWVPAGRISLMGCNLFPLSDSAAAAVRFCPQAALSWFLHYSHL